ncbi:hypothetical protein Q4Q66_02230, partial [Morganella morganii]
IITAYLFVYAVFVLLLLILFIKFHSDRKKNTPVRKNHNAGRQSPFKDILNIPSVDEDSFNAGLNFQYYCQIKLF